MRHATAETIKELEPLLDRLRSLPGLVEKKPGIFYRRSKAFLHFHEDLRGWVYFAGRRAALACPYDIALWEMVLEGAAGHEETALTQTWHDAPSRARRRDGDPQRGRSTLGSRLNHPGFSAWLGTKLSS